MKKTTLLYFVFVLLTALFGCSKEKQKLLNTTWKVESMKEYSDSALMYPPDSGRWEGKTITLSFPKINKYAFKMEVNGTGSRVSIVGNKINFKSGATTAVCCDSPFAESCAYLLVNKITHYKISNDKLILTGNKGEKIILVEQ